MNKFTKNVRESLKGLRVIVPKDSPTIPPVVETSLQSSASIFGLMATPAHDRLNFPNEVRACSAVPTLNNLYG